MEILPVESELFNADRQTGGHNIQTDMTKLRVAFRKFTKAPRNVFGLKLNKRIL